LLPKLAEAKLPVPRLIGVVRESSDIDDFLPFFKGGELYFDADASLFKSIGDRWLGGRGFLMASVWRNVLRAMWRGYPNNGKGDGTMLGGVLVVGPREQGILFQHSEMVWGDIAKPDDVLAAVRHMNRTTSRAN